MRTPYQTGRAKSRKRKQLGQALVEFSLILPILLFILLGILDYGRILLVFTNASGATRDAARQGTLVGRITDPQTGPVTPVPRYMACATIQNLGQNVFGATINSVDILYFNTEGLDSGQRATVAANLDALDPTNIATLAGADYDCADDVVNGPRNQNPDITEGAIETGDLMVILLSTRIDFITPLLSSLFPSFELSFRAQRTLVDALVLNVTGTDRDADGLLDSYELSRFGCVLDGTESKSENEIVYLLPDGALAFNDPGGWSYVMNATTYVASSSPSPNAPPPGVPVDSGYNIPADCAREDLSDRLFTGLLPSEYAFLDCQVPDPDPATEGDTIGDCIIVATDLFSSTSDPDNDGCNNGCEQARGTQPIDYAGGINPGNDSDGDGLSDAAEIGLRTDPNNPDTDGDGLWDGTERCEIVNDVDPTICDSSPTVDPDPSDGIYPYLNGEWTNTDPLNPDTDGDLLEDGDEFTTHNTDPAIGDTDADGLDDGQEINGFIIEDMVINGFTFDSNTITTSALSDDEDGDGILDGDEVNGYEVTYNVNGVEETFVVKTYPNDADTDDDGVCDGDGPACATPADIDPTKTDTDGDGLTDYQEQVDYMTLADNINSDADTCNLGDAFEMLGDQAVASELAYGTYDFDSDGDVNAMDLDSDDDTISDCDEVNTYGSNPYDSDSDLDTHLDNIEILPENWCLEIMRDDSAVSLPCGGVDGGADLDNGGAGDGFPDAWEELYYPDADTIDFSDPANADLDADGCDIQCEYDRRTNPIEPDTDFDGIRDGLETGSNPLIADTDGDGLIDGREGSDTCVDLTYLQLVNPAYTAADCYATNPLLTDSDIDGLTDGAEVNGGATVNINGAPVAVTSDPADEDTDNDGLLDGEEVNGVIVNTVINGVPTSQVTPSNPNSPDSDGDGLQDFLETRIYKTFANNSDTDGDTIQDGSTVGTLGEFPNSFDNSVPYYDTDPLREDSDNDGLTDLEEINGMTVTIRVYDAGGTPTDTSTTIDGYGTNVGDPFATTNLQPRNSDTDGDGLSDGDEINVGDITNPTLANTDGDLNGAGNPIVDGADNCPIHVNSDQQDLDGDNMGSVCDTNGEAATTIYVDPITDASSLVDALNWNPSVIVKAVNTFNQPQSGVDITVRFVNPVTTLQVGASQTCTTVASGECTVDIGSQLQAVITDLDVEVTNLTNPPVGLNYTPADNDGPLSISVPPLSVHVETMTGAVVTGGTPSDWEAEAFVTVEDDFGNLVDGVTVEVTFTDNGGGLVSTETCVSGTTAAGECRVSSGASSYDGTDPDATATVTDITNLGAFGYDDTSNAAPEVISAPGYEAVTAGATNGVDNGNSWTASLIVSVANNSGTLLSGRDVSFSYQTTTRGGSVNSGTVDCISSTNGSGECTVSLSGLTDNGNNNIVCTVEFDVTNVTGVSDPYDGSFNTGFPVTVINPNYGGDPTCP